MVLAYREWLDRITVLSLCAIIVTLPFSKSAIEIFFVIALVSWILKKLLFRDTRNNVTSLNLPICLFVLAGFLSMCLSASIVLSLKGFFFKLLKGVILYILVAETVNDKKKLRIILGSMLLSMALMGADGVFQRITGKDFLRGYDIYGAGVRASFSNPNGFGGWIIVMIPIALSIVAIGKIQALRKIEKNIIWALIFILTLCLALTRSNGAWLGLVFAMILFLMLKKSTFFLIATIFVLVIPIVIIPFLMNVYPGLTILLRESLSVNSWSSAISLGGDFLLIMKRHLVSIMLVIDVSRTNLWREALLIIKDFPVFGCGLNTYSIVAPHYKSGEVVSGIYPHNSYLQMAAETGLVGLISFTWVIFALFKTSLNSLKKNKDEFYSSLLIGLLAGITGFLVHSFFDVNLYALQLVALMWFVMGLIIAVQRIALKEESNPGECSA